MKYILIIINEHTYTVRVCVISVCVCVCVCRHTYTHAKLLLHLLLWNPCYIRTASVNFPGLFNFLRTRLIQQIQH